jgi:hypothetical protein
MNEPSPPEEPKVRLVALMLCELCISGAGGQCHTPGCALWMNCAPDCPITVVADLKVEMADA